ncbi:uncharacterized protein LOC124178256 [Neodiprion fabricii]|uniref:uncharacterized protein LOC124178256 n=1 Tax=Neodiprion fabricii TaxID=2872261 RepID=UPI001ED8C6D6|nr:uncharacterized protein LOC124178256 [Neodiprion fabricii]
MTKGKYGRNRPPQYWWTNEIAELRKSCLAKRRRVTRAGRRPERETLQVKDKAERNRLTLGARIPPELKDAETTRRIVDGLFPTHPTRTDATNDDETAVPSVFTAEELVGATKAMKRGKAPGPDGVPAEVLRLMASLRPEILLDLYNTCLTTGTFSDRWKVLLRPRLTDAIQDGGGLSDQQFGFRRGRSTIGAIQEVVDSFRSTDRHCHSARPVALLMTLDVKNAFNSARLELPLGVRLVAYADDVAAVIVERTPDLAQYALNQTMRRVRRWMTDHGLQLATEKTELVLLTRRRIPKTLRMTVGTDEIETRGEVKYLGVTLDTKMTFWPHIRRTAQKAAEKIASLSRLMAYTTGPTPGKRRLLMSTVNSILLYGAEIWADSLKTEKYCHAMTTVQRRRALRIACSYRTVSAQVVLVVTGVISIDLLAFKRKKVYGRNANVT